MNAHNWELNSLPTSELQKLNLSELERACVMIQSVYKTICGGGFWDKWIRFTVKYNSVYAGLFHYL